MRGKRGADEEEVVRAGDMKEGGEMRLEIRRKDGGGGGGEKEMRGDRV